MMILVTLIFFFNKNSTNVFIPFWALKLETTPLKFYSASKFYISYHTRYPLKVFNGSANDARISIKV